MFVATSCPFCRSFPGFPLETLDPPGKVVRLVCLSLQRKEISAILEPFGRIFPIFDGPVARSGLRMVSIEEICSRLTRWHCSLNLPFSSSFGLSLMMRSDWPETCFFFFSLRHDPIQENRFPGAETSNILEVRSDRVLGDSTDLFGGQRGSTVSVWHPRKSRFGILPSLLANESHKSH